MLLGQEVRVKELYYVARMPDLATSDTACMNMNSNGNVRIDTYFV